MEIQQQWISTPFEDHITVSQDLSQDPQVNTVELSFDLHFPNITQERINIPPVVHNDCTLKEFIQGEERCLKFINQDLMFLQELHIPSTFTNVPHTTTSLKEPVHINLPTRISNEHTSKENNSSSCTQSIQPTLGFTLAEVCQAKSNPTLTVSQLLEIEPCREYTETPKNARQPVCNTTKKVLATLVRGKEVSRRASQGRNGLSMGRAPTQKTFARVLPRTIGCPTSPCVMILW